MVHAKKRPLVVNNELCDGQQNYNKYANLVDSRAGAQIDTSKKSNRFL